MILWTIQTEQAFKVLQSNGVLRSSRELAEEYFLTAYEWMIEQMKVRLPVPPPTGAYPLWAWYQREGLRNGKRRQPDLRSIIHYYPREKGYRIAFEVQEHEYLLSDFSRWHYVLNGWYLPLSEEDDQRFEQKTEALGYFLADFEKVKEPEIKQEIIQSWDRIFEINDLDTYTMGEIETRSIQATFWELRLDQVRKVTEFTGKNSRWNST